MKNELDEHYVQFCEEKRINFITFHPSYSYEEFVEGISVKLSDAGVKGGEIGYFLKPGIFKEMCKRALGAAVNIPDADIEKQTWKEIYDYYCNNRPVDFNAAQKYVLIIDEINRGDIAKLFGELITLLEDDKRIGKKNEIIVELPASGDKFGVPPNLYIIGTMNTADRSIALLDVALRRRFGFVEMNPDFGILKKEHIEKNESLLKENKVFELLNKSIIAIELINEKICIDPVIGRDRQIGHSFFFKVLTNNDLVMVWRYEVLPLLEEYCYGDYKKINRILFNLDSDSEWITEAKGIQEISNMNIHRMLD